MAICWPSGIAQAIRYRYRYSHKAKSPRLMPGVGGKILSAKPLRAEAKAIQEENTREGGRLAARRLTRRRA
ncbi:hypothetical protein I0P70_00775 [Pontibacter sp. FD36]|uniref:hypothetical protein n=1 Tax=Pontibacter sp. FD36 TaxID=2789860 RepID=UPI0018ABD840|nr:hypothetical protein [Pontibacter sp. FD36]MBF8961762.1 hypothetical protein [Pontibacter sp. FD36]